MRRQPPTIQSGRGKYVKDWAFSNHPSNSYITIIEALLTNHSLPAILPCSIPTSLSYQTYPSMGWAPMNVPHVEDAGSTAAVAEITVVVDVTVEVVDSNQVVVVDNKADGAGVALILFLGMYTDFVEELRGLEFPILRWDIELVEE